MQENLKGRTILVGKEPTNGRLLVSLKFHGQAKSAAIGLPGSVPSTVSRCFAQEGVAHMRLDISPNGTITITNLKPQNVTYVNGLDVTKKVINENCKIALGSGRFPIDLPEVLDTASKVVKAVEGSGTYNIKPLQKVWDDYETYVTKQKTANGRFAALASASGLFTIGSFVLTMPDIDVNPNIRYVMYGIAFVLTLTTFIKRFLDAKRLPIKQKEELNKFQKKYVCPNPDCHHFVGSQPYDILRQNKNCPYCKCKWVEK